MGADKKASQAAEQTVAATMQPTQETSIPSVPVVATTSVKAGLIKKKGSYAENIFDLAVSPQTAARCTQHCALICLSFQMLKMSHNCDLYCHVLQSFCSSQVLPQPQRPHSLGDLLTAA